MSHMMGQKQTDAPLSYSALTLTLKELYQCNSNTFKMNGNFKLAFYTKTLLLTSGIIINGVRMHVNEEFLA